MQPGNVLHYVMFFLRLPRSEKEREHRFSKAALVVQRLRLAILLVLLSLTVGTVGFMLIEHYPLLDAWYMSVITLASVGFGEVYPLSDTGRVFTSFLILFNVGLFAYSISTITGIVTEGGLSRLIYDLRMTRNIDALEGHTIVCGYGRHATEVAQELAKQNIPFVIVENNPAKVSSMREETGLFFIEGDATHDAILEAAGIRRASALVVTLPSDADNLFIVMSARQMNPSLRIIARANSGVDEPKIRRAGADHTVVPERIGGFYMATLVNKPDLVEFFTLLSNIGPSNVVFEEIPVSRLLPDFQGKTIAGGGLLGESKISVVAVRSSRGQYELNPSADTKLEQDLRIVVLGNPEQMAFFRANYLTENT